MDRDGRAFLGFTVRQNSLAPFEVLCGEISGFNEMRSIEFAPDLSGAIPCATLESYANVIDSRNYP
jgi:hypothetical protein